MARRRTPTNASLLHPHPASLQIEFWARLQQFRNLYLADALAQAVAEQQITKIDEELRRIVGNTRLAIVAANGLRGERVYPVPVLLKAYPRLIGYYRLLYGLSQKEFYKAEFARFRSMELDNQLSEEKEALLPQLCRSMARTATDLLRGVQPVSLNSIHELQLLTLGPQLRGSQNVAIGKGATKQVFDLVRELVSEHLESTTEKVLSVKNAAGRIVHVAFAADPDITIIETLPSGPLPNTSIEIKGGTDVSNVHNRIGEAEKSHLNAKKTGFTRFWTILKARVDGEHAKRQSPTSTAFFNLDGILNRTSKEHARFKELLHQTIGIS